MVRIGVEWAEVLQESTSSERISDRKHIVVEKETQGLFFWDGTEDSMVRISG